MSTASTTAPKLCLVTTNYDRDGMMITRLRSDYTYTPEQAIGFLNNRADAICATYPNISLGFCCEPDDVDDAAYPGMFLEYKDPFSKIFTRMIFRSEAF